MPPPSLARRSAIAAALPTIGLALFGCRPAIDETPRAPDDLAGAPEARRFPDAASLPPIPEQHDGEPVPGPRTNPGPPVDPPRARPSVSTGDAMPSESGLPEDHRTPGINPIRD